MTTPPSSQALAVAPDAILLDFGGVVFQTRKLPQGRDEVTARLVARIERAGHHVDAAALRASLDSALAALGHWKHASSRRLEPREMTHREIVRDFIAADLPEGPRDALIADASEVLADLNAILSSHEVRPGIRELIGLAQQRGIPLGIVSNAHSGRSHRRLLAEHGLDTAFGVQVYSDEVGMRKPHPRMITLACDALGVSASRAWYVGDTQDRDVVAGRRAGVAAVMLTASKHTDSPPYGVAAVADAVFETPEGVASALRSARVEGSGDRPADAAPARVEPTAAPSGALLIDHGGVISTSQPDPEAMLALATHLARLLAGSRPGSVSPEQALALVERGRERHRLAKRLASAAGDLAEVDPIGFWRDHVGVGLEPRQRAVLEAESHDLMFRYGMAKSRRTLRPGVRALLEACRGLGMPVVVVSNTVSGRAVRETCRANGIDELIAAYVCSDEVGVRKPARAIVDEALRVAGAAAADSWFYGDKPQNDAVAADAAGIGRRVLVRGGTTEDAPLEAALAEGLATDVVDGAEELRERIAARRGALADADPAGSEDGIDQTRLTLSRP